LAWLNSSPKENKNDDKPTPRIESLSKDDPLRDMPEVDNYLVNCFYLSGVYLTNGMGITPLTWVEINSFTNVSGYDLNNWEAEQLILMSREYCNMSHKANDDIDCPPPFDLTFSDGDALKRSRDIINRKMEAFFCDR